MPDAKSQAIAQCATIVEMVAAYNVDFDRLQELRETRAELDSAELEELEELEEAAGEYEDQEAAERAIQEDPLSVEYRSSWTSDTSDMEAAEFRVLLCTGAPHVEILGELDRYNEPARVRVIYKDWGESGELFEFDHDAVLEYCRIVGVGSF